MSGPDVVPDRSLIAPTPLRSLLFVPGHRSNWFESAFSSGADAVIFDLSDSVPMSEIESARRAVKGVIEERQGKGPRIFIRVAPAQSPDCLADVEAVLGQGITGLMLPLVNSLDDVRWLDAVLTEREADRGVAPGSTIIFPLVETAFAVRFAYEIATASGRVAYMGGATSRNGDIARAIGFRWSPEGTETLTLRSWVLINMRAAAVPFPVSAMWSIVGNLAGLEAFAVQTRALGYTGMMAIHPSHIPVINAAFTPTMDEIEHWKAVIGALRAAQSRGIGAARHEGEMIDEADAKTAAAMLEFAGRLGIG